MAHRDGQFDGLKAPATLGPLTFVTNHSLAGSDHNKKKKEQHTHAERYVFLFGSILNLFGFVFFLETYGCH